MIKLNEKVVTIDHFPDGTILMKEYVEDPTKEVVITWNYENNEEMMALYFLTNHLQDAGVEDIILDMPYIPNARQDRVKEKEDIFTLKYFAKMLNTMNFKEVRVLDAHSNVSLALIDRVKLFTPQKYIEEVIKEIKAETKQEVLMFYPDEGAGKRYSGMITLPYCFGIKKRDWSTGKIKGLDVAGEAELIEGSNILIVDDICSKGGTFLHSAKKLKELGANKLYLFISHCEPTILQGELLKENLFEQIYTTDSIFKQELSDEIKVI